MTHVHGLVLDNRDNPVENATITIPAVGKFALSGEDGTFVIQDVPSSLYRINVIHRHFQKFSADVRLLEDTDIIINLDQNAFGY